MFLKRGLHQDFAILLSALWQAMHPSTGARSYGAVARHQRFLTATSKNSGLLNRNQRRATRNSANAHRDRIIAWRQVCRNGDIRLIQRDRSRS